ncbi:uncharacterized protein [Rutidosis leptorrhynchoides]|uniref:uncharacterized protein n=1 Tax=Rutidosis leptorrhynchoides TaxID=125765 RepID=UPI003A997BAF
MAAKSSIAPDILWNWVIEALANFEQVDIHTLIGLVKMAPAISGDAGENARELVSFRILEDMFARDNETIVNNDASQKDKISFDESERCEDVLKKILHETPERVAKLEKGKWDVRPFIMHKRSVLPKCSLKKLKDVMLETSHPLLASLKEKGKLVISNVSEDINPVIDDIHGTQTTDDIAMNPRNDENKIQENVLQEDDQVENHTEEITEHAANENREVVIEHTLEGTSGSKSIECNTHANSQNAQERAMNRDGQNEKTTFSERVIDERVEIDAQKEAFINSQVTITQDSLSMTEFSELDLCMKCNEGGQLLVCRSESCMLRIHENCLGYDVTLDENEEFFCPFCAYSRAISEYLEAKRKASMARKYVRTFSGFRVKRIPNKCSKKHSESEKNETETTERNGNENTAQPDPPIPVVNDDVDIEIGSLNEETTELFRNPIPEASAPKKKRKEKENQLSPESSCLLRPRKKKAQYTDSPIPLLRRKIIPWTKSEEEMLKEGVARYSDDAMYKGIPWKEILYFGRNVFPQRAYNYRLKRQMEKHM